MRHRKSIFWVFSFAAMYVLFPHIFYFAFNGFLPFFGVSPNRATAAGYSFELMIYVFCFVALIGRVSRSMAVMTTLGGALSVLRTKVAVAALSIAVIVFVGGRNRAFWWFKHMFTDEAYNHVEYTGAVNSTLVAIAMISLIFAVFPRKKIGGRLSLDDFGSDRLALMMLMIGVAAMFLGGYFYGGRE